MKSITFSDSKRVFTKDLLMRIGLLKLFSMFSQQKIEEQVFILNDKYNLSITLSKWNSFIAEMTPKEESQLSIFD